MKEFFDTDIFNTKYDKHFSVALNDFVHNYGENLACRADLRVYSKTILYFADICWNDYYESVRDVYIDRKKSEKHVYMGSLMFIFYMYCFSIELRLKSLIRRYEQPESTHKLNDLFEIVSEHYKCYNDDYSKFIKNLDKLYSNGNLKYLTDKNDEGLNFVYESNKAIVLDPCSWICKIHQLYEYLCSLEHFELPVPKDTKFIIEFDVPCNEYDVKNYISDRMNSRDEYDYVPFDIDMSQIIIEKKNDDGSYRIKASAYVLQDVHYEIILMSFESYDFDVISDVYSDNFQMCHHYPLFTNAEIYGLDKYIHTNKH